MPPVLFNQAIKLEVKMLFLKFNNLISIKNLY